MKKLLNIILLLHVLACNCHAFSDEEVVEMVMSHMSLREKVGQLFIVRPESGDSLDFKQYPVGGYCLFAPNITDSTSLEALMGDLRSRRYSPLLCIDEEGGRVARIGRNENFDVPRFPPMKSVARGGADAVRDAAFAIGSYLHRFGFDVDFAPVADVDTNPDNPVIGSRAFSEDPAMAAKMVRAYLEGLSAAGVQGCLKHFPGHGDTVGDSHKGYVEVLKTWEQMQGCELLPFVAGIEAGAPMVMVGHISLPHVTGSIPASFSDVMMIEKLRGELGFGGLIISDSMGMDAVSGRYPAEILGAEALKAGLDIILMPKNLALTFDSLVQAVEEGIITEERLDASVRRILLFKRSIGRI